MPGDDPDQGREEAIQQLRRQLETESGDSLKLLADIEKNPVCSIFFDSSVPCVVVRWKRYATSSQLRFIHEMMLDLLKEYSAGKILADETELPTIHPEDQTWIAHDWMPRAIAAGLKACAAKNPASYFGQLSVTSLRDQAPPELVIRAFDDITAAQQWLASFNPSSDSI